MQRLTVATVITECGQLVRFNYHIASSNGKATHHVVIKHVLKYLKQAPGQLDIAFHRLKIIKMYLACIQDSFRPNGIKKYELVVIGLTITSYKHQRHLLLAAENNSYRQICIYVH